MATNNKSTNDTTNDATDDFLQFEKLQQQYGNLLTMYKQAVSDYITYIQTNSSNREFVTLQNKLFKNGANMSIVDASNVDLCQQSCELNPNCIGASFANNVCQINQSSSDYEYVNAKDTTLILEKSKYMLINIQIINVQLIDLNRQMQVLIVKLEPTSASLNRFRERNKQRIIREYEALEEERKAVEQVMESYDSLNALETNESLRVNRNYYLFLIFMFIAIGCLYALIKVIWNGSSDASSSSSSSYNYSSSTDSTYVPS